MRNALLIGISASIAFVSAANAQSEREIRKDQRAVEAHQVELEEARSRGHQGDIQEAREDLRGARQELREDRRHQQASRYEAPYRNWSQSTPAVGTRLRSKFYGTRYAISNPHHYRLGTAARGQRWIRYGDDVLLVNVRSGRVAEVLPRRYRDM